MFDPESEGESNLQHSSSFSALSNDSSTDGWVPIQLFEMPYLCMCVFRNLSLFFKLSLILTYLISY